MKLVNGNVGRNYLSSPTDEVDHDNISGVNVFETILLSDVFEAMHYTTRHKHDTGPLTVLVV